MVLISDKKYACEACIKGHRSSACKHTDRPLFEIKKKGRPITQCEHCRELRKTKQVHVKCMCEAKEHPSDKELVPVRKKGNLARVLASAAFPDGLPQVLGASVATHSNDSFSPVDLTTCVCRCKDGADCHCSSAKKPTRSKAKDAGPPPLVSSSGALSAPIPLSLHALRPVLPRPAPQSSLHEHVALQAYPHGHRFSHGSAFFSPYGRAYEEHHYSSEEGHADSLSENGMAAHRSTDLMAWSSDSSGHSFSQKTFPPSSMPDFQDELEPPEFPAGFRGSCTCGKTCACSPCLQHRGPGAWTSREACSNPGSCNGCFPISEVPPHPAPTPPTTPQDGRQQFEPLDEWFESIQMIPPSFEDVSKQEMVDYPLLDLPKIVEPMPITLDSLPDVFHEPTSQCICSRDQRMRFGDYCMRCQRRCDDHDPADLLATSFAGERARCVSSNITMLDVPPPRSRASSTSSVASDISSLYPPSIEDTNGTTTGSFLPPSISRVRRLASDIASSPLVGNGVGPAYALPYRSSAPNLAHPSLDSFDASYSGPISVLF
ncbi:hypothetical protein F5148DRAFT_1156048 [Russula earlei]|uniref:Uncharacterized protein n=1 Tax=Russula earlei TaxID=71964 RepID=A0ACC0UPF4_9AGAM|nr:hypothetical protein F5148DRAFT_1156048 [Russula earlei]